MDVVLWGVGLDWVVLIVPAACGVSPLLARQEGGSAPSGLAPSLLTPTGYLAMVRYTISAASKVREATRYSVCAGCPTVPSDNDGGPEDPGIAFSNRALA